MRSRRLSHGLEFTAVQRGFRSGDGVRRPREVHARHGHLLEPHARREKLDGFGRCERRRVSVLEDGGNRELSKGIELFVVVGRGRKVGSVDGGERATDARVERRAHLTLRGCARGPIAVPWVERREQFGAGGRRGRVRREPAALAAEMFFQLERESRARRRGERRVVVEDARARHDRRLD